MTLDWDRMNRRERKLVGGLLEALVHTQTLSELVSSTEEFLIQLVSADCMALCASRLGQPTLDDWLVAKMPAVYFDGYADRKKEDFVRAANLKQHNVVLRDTDIIAREELEATSIYRYGHDHGVPLEQVMAVYLTQAGWEGNGGFSAYRLKRRPFSDRERNIIQQIAPLLADAIQKCQVFVERELTGRLLEMQTDGQKPALLVWAAPGVVVKKTAPVSEVMKKWFSAMPCDPSGLPLELVARLAARMKRVGSLETGTDFWELQGEGEALRVMFVQLPPVGGHSYWQLRFEAVTHPLIISWLKKLTPKQVEVASLLAQGLSDKEIADKARCKLGTVKKHLGHIYKRLKADGVGDRKEFIARAMQRGKTRH